MQKDDHDIGVVYGWLTESPDRPDRSRVHDKSQQFATCAVMESAAYGRWTVI